MFIHRRRPHDPQGGSETPRSVVMNRRAWLRTVGLAAGGAALIGGVWQSQRIWQGNDIDVVEQGRIKPDIATNLTKSFFPAPHDERFLYGRDETDRAAAARHTNFYEFSGTKAVWRYIRSFEPHPWTLKIDGHCRAPLTLDFDEFLTRYRDALVERQYLMRCVERWSMAVPWTGVPLATVLRDVDPLHSATHVRFVSFERPDEASKQHDTSFPWPYAEGLTIAEAQIDLVLLAVGMYGEPLLKQHGAPLRLVVPWKYGYKSIKSIERIELVSREPATFWSTIDPVAYPFVSNVDPQNQVPWSQSSERMLGSGERFPTMPFNGYSNEVAGLYLD